MEILPILLTVSLLVNLLLMAGYALIPAVLKLLRLRKSVIIGLHPLHVVVQERRIKGKWFTMKGRDGDQGDVHVDDDLTDRDELGRSVVWVDLRTFHQVQPTEEHLEWLKKSKRDALTAYIGEGEDRQEIKVAKVRPQLVGYAGECLNDEENVEFMDRRGVVKKFRPVWRRVDGRFLLRRRLDLRWSKMDEESGMWAALEKIAPLISITLAVIGLILLIVLLTQVGGGSA